MNVFQYSIDCLRSVGSTWRRASQTQRRGEGSPSFHGIGRIEAKAKTVARRSTGAGRNWAIGPRPSRPVPSTTCPTATPPSARPISPPPTVPCPRRAWRAARASVSAATRASICVVSFFPTKVTLCSPSGAGRPSRNSSGSSSIGGGLISQILTWFLPKEIRWVAFHDLKPPLSNYIEKIVFYVFKQNHNFEYRIN